MPHHVHDAQLHHHPGEHRLNGVRKALEARYTGDEVFCTSRLRSSVTTYSQNLTPSVWASHRPSTSFSPVMVMPMAKYTALPRRAPSRTFT